MNASIVVCTSNRAESLRGTLIALAKQKYDIGRLEIVVIDNDSTDHTAELVQHLKSSLSYPIRYALEEKKGIARARNRALQEASEEIVIFIDDDAIPVSHRWAEALASSFNHPAVHVAGGDLVPSWPDNTKPKWIHDFFLAPLGLTQFGFHEKTLQRFPDFPWAANIAYRKSTALKYGGFLEELGWNESGRMIPGEECELNLRIEKNGGQIFYVPDASVRHKISSRKLSASWLMKRGNSQGITDAVMARLHFKEKIPMKALKKMAAVPVHYLIHLFFLILNNKKQALFHKYNSIHASAFLVEIFRNND